MNVPHNVRAHSQREKERGSASERERERERERGGGMRKSMRASQRGRFSCSPWRKRRGHGYHLTERSFVCFPLHFCVMSETGHTAWCSTMPRFILGYRHEWATFRCICESCSVYDQTPLREECHSCTRDVLQVDCIIWEWTDNEPFAIELMCVKYGETITVLNFEDLRGFRAEVATSRGIHLCMLTDCSFLRSERRQCDKGDHEVSQNHLA